MSIVVSVTQEMFRRHKYGADITAREFDDILASQGVHFPTGGKAGIATWRNNRRYQLNDFGRNLPALNNSPVPRRVARYGFQLDFVDQNLLYRLRTAKQSIRNKNQLFTPTRYMLAMQTRLRSLAEFNPTNKGVLANHRRLLVALDTYLNTLQPNYIHVHRQYLIPE